MTGHKIRELRKKHRYSQRQLAELLGVAQTVVSGWETGARRIKVDTLRRIADVLNEPITDFIQYIPVACASQQPFEETTRTHERTVGENIKFFRKQTGLTQRQLGEKVGVAEGTIQQYELGKRMPSIKRMEKISSVLGMKSAPILSLNTLRDEIYQDAVAHGLWEDVEKDARELSEEEQPSERERWYTFHRRVYATKLVFFESDELLSAAEEEDWDGLQEEIADVVIQAFSTAGYLGIDIDAAIRRKMEINKNRPWKHGKE